MSIDDERTTDRQTIIFNRMMSDFISHYAPRQPLHRANFAADIATLMRQSSLQQAEIYDRVIRAALGPMMRLTQMSTHWVNKKDIADAPAADQSGVKDVPGQRPGDEHDAPADVLRDQGQHEQVRLPEVEPAPRRGDGDHQDRAGGAQPPPDQGDAGTNAVGREVGDIPEVGEDWFKRATVRRPDDAS